MPKRFLFKWRWSKQALVLLAIIAVFGSAFTVISLAQNASPSSSPTMQNLEEHGIKAFYVEGQDVTKIQLISAADLSALHGGPMTMQMWLAAHQGTSWNEPPATVDLALIIEKQAVPAKPSPIELIADEKSIFSLLPEKPGASAADKKDGELESFRIRIPYAVFRQFIRAKAARISFGATKRTANLDDLRIFDSFASSGSIVADASVQPSQGQASGNSQSSSAQGGAPESGDEQPAMHMLDEEHGIFQQYDKKQDSTALIQWKTTRLLNPKDEPAAIGWVAVFAGTAWKQPPPELTLTLHLMDRKQNCPSSIALMLVIDGKSSAKLNVVKSGTSRLVLDGTNEVPVSNFGAMLPYSLYRSLTKARSIQLQSSGITAEVNPADVIAFDRHLSVASAETPLTDTGGTAHDQVSAITSTTHAEVLNLPYAILSYYEAKSQHTYIGIFDRPLDANLEISYYAVYSPESPTPSAMMGLEIAMIDSKKTDHPVTLPIEFFADGQQLPVTALKFIHSVPSKRRITDSTLTSPVEREVPVFVSTYEADIPSSSLEMLSTAHSYQLTVAGKTWNSETSPLPIKTFPTMRAVINAETKMFASHVLVPYRKGGKFGYADTRGNLVVPPRYDSASTFAGGRARVGVDDPSSTFHFEGKTRRFGYIDATGREIIPLQYDMASSFSLGVAQVHRMNGDKSWRMIDVDGKDLNAGPNAIGWQALTFDSQKGWLDWTGENNTVVYSVQTPNGKKWGFHKTDGTQEIAPVYDWVDFFRNGRTTVQQGKKVFYIDTLGRKIGDISLPTSYDVISGYTDSGIAVIRNYSGCRNHTYPGFSPYYYEVETTCNQTYGYINSSSRLVGGNKYFAAQPFSEGLGAVSVPIDCIKDKCRTRFAYLNTNGKYALPPQFLEAKSFHQGRAAVVFNTETKPSESGYADIAVINTALVGGHAYIDRSGYGPTTIFPATLPDICAQQSCSLELGDFYDDGLALITITVGTNNTKIKYYIDHSGRAYWDGR